MDPHRQDTRFNIGSNNVTSHIKVDPNEFTLLEEVTGRDGVI